MQISQKELKKRAKEGGELTFVGDDGSTYGVDIGELDELPPGRVVLGAGTDAECYAVIGAKKGGPSADPNIAAARIVEAAISGYKELVRAQQDTIDRQAALVERMAKFNEALLAKANDDNLGEIITAVAPQIPVLVPVVEKLFAGIGEAIASAAASAHARRTAREQLP